MSTPDPLLLNARVRAARLGLQMPPQDEDPLLARARERMERISSEMASTVKASIPRSAPEVPSRLADKPATRGAIAGASLGYAPGSELGEDTSLSEKVRYGVGYMAGSIPYAVTGSVATRLGAGAVAASPRAPTAARAVGRYLSEPVGGVGLRSAPARAAARQAGAQNVAEGLAFTAMTEPVRKLPEGVSRAESVALNTGVGMAIDLPVGVAMGRYLGPAARAAGATRPRPVPIRAEIPPPERTPRGRVERGTPEWIHGIDDRARVNADPNEPMSQAAVATRRANELRAPDRIVEDDAARLQELQGRAAMGETPATPLILGPDGRPIRVRPPAEIEEPGPVLEPRQKPELIPESHRITSRSTSGPELARGEVGEGPDWTASQGSRAEPLLYGPEGPVRRARPGESVPDPEPVEDPLLAAARRRAAQLRAAGEDDPRKLVTDVAGEAAEEIAPETSIIPRFRSKAADAYAAEAMATEDARSVFGILASAANDTKVAGREKQPLLDFLTQRLEELGGTGGAPAVERPTGPRTGGPESIVTSGPPARTTATARPPAASRDKVKKLIQEKRSAQRALEVDPLTGAGNRAAWEKARASAEADPEIEVVTFDLNNLKALNDVVGHDAGDAAIREAVEAVRGVAGPRVFRIGGDEIVALVPKGRGIEVTEGAARAFGERPAGEFTASLTGTTGQTFAEADGALQAAKQARKGPTGSFRSTTQEPEGISVAPERVADDTDGRRAAADEPERITAAAWRTADGQVFTGANHGEAEAAMRAAGVRGSTDSGETHGFQTSAGRFVTEPEAKELARSAGQPVRDGFRLRSEDVIEQTPAAPRAAAEAAKTVDVGERLTGPEGNITSVVFPDNKRVQARYRVVEADELQPSHNPDTFTPNPRYPAEVQGRRYDLDPAAQERVTEAVQGFDAERALDPTSEVGAGQPLITPDGIAVAGNQRSMILQRLARDRPDAFAAYRQALEQRAEQLGIDPEQLAGMRNPVLVREIVDESLDLTDRGVLRDLNQRSDISVGKTKDPLSDATSRAARLRDDPAALNHLADTMEEGQTLRDYLRGADGRRFVQMLEESRVLDRGELAAMRDAKTGALTDQGADAIERTLQVAAIGDPEVVAVTPKALLNQMEHAYPAIMRAATNEGWDLRGSLQEALRLHAELQGQPAAANIKTVRDLVSGDQGSLLGREDSPDAIRLAQFLEASNKTETKQAFHRYAQEAEIARRQGQSDDLFGFAPKKPGQAFDDAFGATDRMNNSTRKPCQ